MEKAKWGKKTLNVVTGSKAKLEIKQRLKKNTNLKTQYGKSLQLLTTKP